MNHIVVLSANSNKDERECVEQLSARMPDYNFFFFCACDYKGFFREFRFNRNLLRATGKSCLVLVSPGVHAERVASLGKPAVPLPYGVDFEAFNSAAERNLPFPDDLFNVKNPIIGGHLNHLDLKTVEAAANARPEWSFVFLNRLSAPHELPNNVHFVGEKPKAHLPAYISRFDVCVNIANPSLASPEHLYQYLASGKPIVSSPHPAQALDYADAIYLAGTPEEFIALCKKAIGERDAWKARRRVEYGRAARWDARAAELERTIKELSV